MPLDFIYIAVTVAAICSIWVTELTKLDGGLLWWIPKYYPYPETFLGKIMRCSICLAGWCCLITCAVIATITNNWGDVIPTVFISMSLAKIISK